MHGRKPEGIWAGPPKEKNGSGGASTGGGAGKERGWKPDEEVELWPEAVNGAELLGQLDGTIRRHVVLPQGTVEAIALWVLHTYAFGLRDVSTYLGVESPEKRCGKTTLLSVLSELVNRPVVAANISSPAFFRVIEEMQPTLIIDEADTFLRGNDEIRGILNSGYSRKTAFVVRVANETGGRLARFSCWCPKVIAAIGRLPETLADRCIMVRMQRKLGVEKCVRLRELKGLELRRKCARFVRDHEAEILGRQPVIPAELHDRAADIWEPLLALAELAGGEWPEKARQAAIGLTCGTQGGTAIGSLLADIFAIFNIRKADRVFSRDLAEWLGGLEGRPWEELLRGGDVSEYWVAQRLRPFGVRPRTLRMGEQVAKGYTLDELRETFKRYISKMDLAQLRRDAVAVEVQSAESKVQLSE